MIVDCCDGKWLVNSMGNPNTDYASGYLFGFVATLILGIFLRSGLCGFAGKRTEPEGKMETGLLVAFSK